MNISPGLSAAALAVLLAGCSVQDHQPPQDSTVQLKSYSVNPSLVKSLPGFEAVGIYPLISSDDKLEQSPDFIFGAQPDGADLLKNPNGDGFVLINNHEIHQSVSRVYLDKTFKPVKGEYIVDYEGGQWRLCSATMATPEEHGFGPVFLTAGESGAESMVHAIDPLGPADKKNKNRVLPALGKASMENAVPLPKEAFPGKTVIVIGEDDSNGQVLVYVSNSVGDLQNGKLYFLRRVNQDPVETNMVPGQLYDIEFVEVDNPAASTGAQIAAQSVEKKAVQFARVEDIDYRKGGGGERGREFYFTATGVSQADKKTPVTGKTMWGRVYRVNLQEGNPLRGTLQIIADGGVDPGNNIVNPDNLCVTENFVYIQEDGDSFYLDNKHDGRVWQYSRATKELKPMLEMNHRRNEPTFNSKYNTVNSQLLSSWEYGAMYDISKQTGVPNTFLLNLHPHTWQSDAYANPDGSGKSTNKEGGQVVILRGVAK
ncbi:hypothetical protein ACO2Q8_02260 [Larkinella sp. VNQ87]|uniref:hypothetical protein n=1 Tax=Larkinella sp. VNQ87 TaxID=3400921 RepID=UPI003BFBE6A9